MLEARNFGGIIDARYIRLDGICGSFVIEESLVYPVTVDGTPYFCFSFGLLAIFARFSHGCSESIVIDDSRCFGSFHFCLCVRCLPLLYLVGRPIDCSDSVLLSIFIYFLYKVIFFWVFYDLLRGSDFYLLRKDAFESLT